MRLLICGARDWHDEAPIGQQIRLSMPEVVIEGGARGADSIARRLAERIGVPVKEYRPLYAIHGRRAPLIRNHDMLVAGKPTLVVAFTDSIREPRSGTRHMCRIALAAGLPVTVVEHGVGGMCFAWDATPEDVCRLGPTPDPVYP